MRSTWKPFVLFSPSVSAHATHFLLPVIGRARINTMRVDCPQAMTNEGGKWTVLSSMKVIHQCNFAASLHHAPKLSSREFIRSSARINASRCTVSCSDMLPFAQAGRTVHSNTDRNMPRHESGAVVDGGVVQAEEEKV